MQDSNFNILEGFFKQRKNGIIENFHIAFAGESLYLINSSVNYGDYVKSLFSGMGEILGLFGNGIGILGGLASELTGVKFSNKIKSMSEKASKKYLLKVTKNLDVMAEKKDGVTKLNIAQINEIILKKGYLINGKSYIQISHEEKLFKLNTTSRKKITELAELIKSTHQEIIIKTVLT